MTADPRIEAAVKAMHEIRCGSRCKQEPGEVDVVPAERALAAADAVMFSEEAIERAAKASGHKTSVVRAVVAALRGGGE